MTERAERLWSPAIVLVTLLLFVTIAGPWLTPYDANAQLDIIALRSQPPTLAHPFGTDAVGRDVLSRVLQGAQVSMMLAILSAVLSLVVGTMYGALSAMTGGVVHRLMQRALDVALSTPRLLLLLAIAALWGALSLPALILLIGLTGWFGTARVVADELYALGGREFSLAARAIGVRRLRLLWRHLLPHLAPTLVVNASFGIAGTIALEAGLSYLGLGLQPPNASWGTIMRDGSGVIQSEWWLTLFPGVATIFAVLSCNALGDALRDRFAPTHVPSRSAPSLPRAVRP
jgi:peptide/nickel transport system permease protein